MYVEARVSRGLCEKTDRLNHEYMYNSIELSTMGWAIKYSGCTNPGKARDSLGKGTH
jgi:hypothetical protein